MKKYVDEADFYESDEEAQKKVLLKWLDEEYFVNPLITEKTRKQIIANLRIIIKESEVRIIR
jgi:hypothetical protein